MNVTKYFLFMISIAGLLWISSCGSDDEDENPQPTSEIVGTWQYDAVSYDIQVNGIDFVQYVSNELGLSSAEAILLLALFEGGFEEELGLENTTFTFNADGTYRVVSPGEQDETGTYVVNSSETQVTFTSEGETYSADIEELTASRLRMRIVDEDQSEDLNEDGTNDTIRAEVLLTLRK